VARFLPALNKIKVDEYNKTLFLFLYLLHVNESEANVICSPLKNIFSGKHFLVFGAYKKSQFIYIYTY
jgi:hypothetical protein